jgi:acetyl-CoA carboxylase biotin carboxyl carrier protein
MMDLDFVQSLIKALDESGVDSIEIERGGTRIRLSKTPTASAVAIPADPAPSAAPVASPSPVAAYEGGVPSPGSASEDSGLIPIKSPMVGTFYRSPAPNAASYVELGATVTPGETLCIIEAMKLMNELECEVSGVIREICVENGEPVEFGQVLFRVSP